MKSMYWKAILAIVLPCFCARSQTTIFNGGTLTEGIYRRVRDIPRIPAAAPAGTTNGVSATGEQPERLLE